jgi:hypothetical protein
LILVWIVMLLPAEPTTPPEQLKLVVVKTHVPMLFGPPPAGVKLGVPTKKAPAGSVELTARLVAFVVALFGFLITTTVSTSLFGPGVSLGCSGSAPCGVAVTGGAMPNTGMSASAEPAVAPAVSAAPANPMASAVPARLRGRTCCVRCLKVSLSVRGCRRAVHRPRRAGDADESSVAKHDT